MRVGTALLAGLAMLCSGMAGAGEPNGVETYQFPVDFDMTVDCVGETLHITGYIEGRTHVFTTSAGVFHVLDNWTYHYMATDPTERQWLASGFSPYQENAVLEKEDGVHFVSKIRFKPVTDGTPQFFWYESGTFIVNANGDVVVNNYSIVDGNGTCVGPKS